MAEVKRFLGTSSGIMSSRTWQTHINHAMETQQRQQDTRDGEEQLQAPPQSEGLLVWLRETGLLVHCFGECEMAQPLWKTSWAVSEETDPCHFLLGRAGKQASGAGSQRLLHLLVPSSENLESVLTLNSQQSTACVTVTGWQS